MLPFSMRGAIIASAITCFSHTVTLSICLANTITELEPLVWQVRKQILQKDIYIYILLLHSDVAQIVVGASAAAPRLVSQR